MDQLKWPDLQQLATREGDYGNCQGDFPPRLRQLGATKCVAESLHGNGQGDFPLPPPPLRQQSATGHIWGAVGGTVASQPARELIAIIVYAAVARVANIFTLPLHMPGSNQPSSSLCDAPGYTISNPRDRHMLAPLPSRNHSANTPLTLAGIMRNSGYVHAFECG